MSDDTIKAINFEIDFFPGQRFDGFTSGDTWNGFACPRFTLEQGKRVAAMWNTTGKRAQYIEDEDIFVFEPLYGSEDIEKFSAEIINGIKFYPIGANSWIWSEAESNG